ncbi:hypothetical protein EsH8_VI_000820 [Colletotrichum jinshuiense]
MGRLLSIETDLGRFFLPYGTVAWINNVIAFWIWASLLTGRAPLNPRRRIKHTTLVNLWGVTWLILLAVAAIIKVPHLETPGLKTITIGHVIAAVIVHGSVLWTMNKDKADEKTKKIEKGPNNEGWKATEGATGTTAEENKAPNRPSTESVRSTSSTSTVVSASEKTGFLDTFATKITGIKAAEAMKFNGDEDNETPKKEETDAQACRGLLVGLLCLSPGHVVMFCGVVQIGKSILTNRRMQDVRQQREVRDVFILFAVLFGLTVIAAIIGLIATNSNGAAHSEDEESVDAKEKKTKQAAEMQKSKLAILFGMGFVAGILSLWCQYYILAAAAKDTHGTAHLGQVENLSLVYIILSKLMLFAC